MYIKLETNQDVYNTRRIIEKPIPGKLFDGDILKYLASLTSAERKIAEIFLDFKDNKNETHPSNEHIAGKAGSSVRTVIRATNKFHQAGFIYKQQRHIRSLNFYTFNSLVKKGVGAYNYRLHTLSASNQELLMTHGMYQNNKVKKSFPSEYVTLNYSYNLYNKFIYKTKPINARAREESFDDGFISKQQEIRKHKIHKGIGMLKEEQKKWILQHKTDPKVKELLNSEKVKPLLISPLMEEITYLLDLDQREQLKLVAYDDSALQYALDEINRLFEQGKYTRVKDRMAWLVTVATAFCDKNNTTPDWRFYFQICEILGIPTIKEGEDPKPMRYKKPKRVNNIGHSMYDLFKAPEEDPVEVQEAKLTKDITNFTEQLNNPDKYFTGFLKEESMKFIQQRLVECKEQLNQLTKEYDGIKH